MLCPNTIYSWLLSLLCIRRRVDLRQHVSSSQEAVKKEAGQRKTVYICEKCPIPEHMTLNVTLSSSDFGLEIPEGAIPEGERLTNDVGVALFGPFQFPEGLRPVSPVFWVCVRDNPNFQFSKPVTVTIPHFLHLENDEDIQSLGLTFLKADHNKNSDGLYEFQPTSGEMDFRTSAKHGILQTTHFCSLCIACEDIPEALEKTKFCITAVLPNSPIRKRTYAYFFVTLKSLKTCLRRLDQIIEGMNLVGYEVKRDVFEFKRDSTKSLGPNTDSEEGPALQIAITQPTTGRIGVTGTRTV